MWSRLWSEFVIRLLTGFRVGAAFMAALLAARPAVAQPALPAPREHTQQLPAPREAEPTPLPAGPSRPQPAQNPDTAVGRLGLAGQVQCWNCAPFTARARLTHYDPMRGKINCWDWSESEKYCYSPTIWGIHWKSLWGFTAACAPEWKLGTWIAIPQVGAFICADRGNEVLCADGVCNVDILGPSGPWDGKTVDVTLWVPLDPPRKE